MCTVTFIARRHGYALGMNRDEKLARVKALPPALLQLGNYRALHPSEPGGGTWVGVNAAGVTLALINWYSIHDRVSGPTNSRGEVVKRAFPSDSARMVNVALAHEPLARVNPFRLIGVFPAQQAVVEWRWNLRHLERLEHDWRTRHWASSGFDEPGAQRARGVVFRQAMQGKTVGRLDWLQRLHRSHGPERGPYSVCMHREDAATVSYTEITVSRKTATLRYTPGAPCCTAPMPALRLPLQSVSVPASISQWNGSARRAVARVR